MDIVQLAAELTSDPAGLGYAAHLLAGDDEGVATLLNTTYPLAPVVWRSSVPVADILASVVWSEVSGWTAVKVNWLNVLLSTGVVDATQQRIRDIFAGIFSGAANSLANVSAIAKVVGPTRAEVLWGADTTVTSSQIAEARKVM